MIFSMKWTKKISEKLRCKQSSTGPFASQAFWDLNEFKERPRAGREWTLSCTLPAAREEPASSKKHVYMQAKSLQSLWPHGLKPSRLLCPWDSPGKNTGVGCHALLQGIFLTQGANPCFLCLLHCQVGSLPLAPPALQKTYFKSNNPHLVWFRMVWECRGLIQ